MPHRIREALVTNAVEPLTSTVEADETYISGRWKNRPKRKRKRRSQQAVTAAKTPVFGMVQRNGRVRVWTVSDVTAKTLLPKLRDSIHHDATLYTDSTNVYKHVNEYFLKHASVNHSAEEYVRGDVHTNSIEGFWSYFKRTIDGTYTRVSVQHFDRYLAEQTFCYDERRNDGPRFTKATKGADERRLTYKTLTGK